MASGRPSPAFVQRADPAGANEMIFAIDVTITLGALVGALGVA
jgi:hypothetical protein